MTTKFFGTCRPEVPETEVEEDELTRIGFSRSGKGIPKRKAIVPPEATGGPTPDTSDSPPSDTISEAIGGTDESDNIQDGSVALIPSQEADLAARIAENDIIVTHSATAKVTPIRGTVNPSSGGDIVISTEGQYTLLVGMFLLGSYAWHKRRIRQFFARL
jgi:hypothetical protein